MISRIGLRAFRQSAHEQIMYRRDCTRVRVTLRHARRHRLPLSGMKGSLLFLGVARAGGM